MADRPAPVVDSAPEKILNIEDLKKAALQKLPQHIAGMESCLWTGKWKRTL